MRRYLLPWLACLLALSVAAPAHAQRWSGALKGGGTLTQFSGETFTGVDFDPRFGIVGGVTLGFDFGTGFAVLAELLYTRKGANFDDPNRDIPLRIRSSLAYLEAPLLAQYRLETSGYVHPKLFAGPMVAYLLDAQIEFRAIGSDLVQAEEDTSVETLDFGAVFGAGVEVEVGDQRLSFEARASLGMADINKPVPDLGDPTLRNTGVVFLVGVLF